MDDLRESLHCLVTPLLLLTLPRLCLIPCCLLGWIQVFIVDFTHYYDLGLLEAASYAFLEVPTAVFFVDGPLKKKKRSDAKLMPLAIKFTVYNQNVYSPMDTRADW